MLVHHLVPDSSRQPVVRLAVPGNVGYLKMLTISLVEDGAAVEDAERNVTRLNCVEVLRAGDVEIEGAGQFQVYQCAVAETGHGNARVHPQHGAYAATPAVRLAKKIAQHLLLGRNVMTAGWLDLYLTA